MMDEKYDDNQVQQDPVEKMVNSLQINKIQNLAGKARSSLSKRQSVQFDEQLHLDVIIDKILLSLQQVNVLLSDLRLNHMSDIKGLEHLCDDIQNYKKTILLRQSQFGMSDFLNLYIKQYANLQKFMIPKEKVYQHINVFILSEIIEKQLEYLELYKNQIASIKVLIEEKSSKLKKACNGLKNSKLIAIAQLFPYACIVPNDDLFSFNKSHIRWQKLFKSCVEYRIYGSKDKISLSFDTLRNNLNVINATMSILNRNKNLSPTNIKDWQKYFESYKDMAKVALFKGQAQKQAQMMISEGDKQLAKDIWNLPEKKVVKNIISASLPSIVYSEQIFIPRIYRQYLDQNNNFPNHQIKHITSYGNDLFSVKKYSQRLMLRINSPYMIRRKYDEPKSKSEGFFNLNNFTNPFKKLTEHTPKKLIYHIHGGGFISMSTFVHQTYTRLWANQLQIPIVSVEYGKAPNHPFPQGLYDCFEGYMWTLYCFQQIFHVVPQRIILVGDSAGGNLVAALTTLIIQRKLHKPDGIVLVYPALNLNPLNYTPSLLTALNDMILPHSFLKVCLQQYMKTSSLKPQSDPHLSPLMTPDQILKHYPPTRIFVGSCDPFHDDCLRFTERLNNINPGIVSLLIFEQFPHGFLQFHSNLQPHAQCQKAINEVQNALKQLLQK